MTEWIDAIPPEPPPEPSPSRVGLYRQHTDGFSPFENTAESQGNSSQKTTPTGIIQNNDDESYRETMHRERMQALDVLHRERMQKIKEEHRERMQKIEEESRKIQEQRMQSFYELLQKFEQQMEEIVKEAIRQRKRNEEFQAEQRR